MASDKPTFRNAQQQQLTDAEDLAAKTREAADQARAATAATAELVPMTERSREELLAEIQRLTGELDETKRQVIADAQSSGQRARYLGKTKERDKVPESDDYPNGVREIDTELWEYTIDLPPSGGNDIGINGFKFFHGQTYKVTTNTLRDLMDKVHRCWWHEGNIRGSNENAYRQLNSRSITNGRMVNL